MGIGVANGKPSWAFTAIFLLGEGGVIVNGHVECLGILYGSNENPIHSFALWELNEGNDWVSMNVIEWG